MAKKAVGMHLQAEEVDSDENDDSVDGLVCKVEDDGVSEDERRQGERQVARGSFENLLSVSRDAGMVGGSVPHVPCSTADSSPEHITARKEPQKEAAGQLHARGNPSL